MYNLVQMHTVWLMSIVFVTTLFHFAILLWMMNELLMLIMIIIYASGAEVNGVAIEIEEDKRKN